MISVHHYFAETYICDVTWRSIRNGLMISIFILICLIASTPTVALVIVSTRILSNDKEGPEKKDQKKRKRRRRKRYSMRYVRKICHISILLLDCSFNLRDLRILTPLSIMCSLKRAMYTKI